MNVEMEAVNILPEVFEKIMFWVDACDKEISGMGKVSVIDGGYWVTEAYLLEQEVTATTTDIDAVSLGKLMSETIKEEGFLNFWWHSHVNMGVTWSGTDVATIKEFGANGMMVATVFNKRRETRTAFCQAGDDFLPSLFIDNIKLVISSLVDEDEEEAWKKEMDEKVRLPKPVTITPNKGTPYGGNTQYFADYDDDSYTDSYGGGWSAGKVWCEKRQIWARPEEAVNAKDVPQWHTVPMADKRKWAKCYEEYMGQIIDVWEPPLRKFYYEWAEVSSINQLLQWEGERA